MYMLLGGFTDARDMEMLPGKDVENSALVFLSKNFNQETEICAV